MPKLPRLIRRCGRYSIRVRVPDELRPIIRKREIWRSLDTADHHEAVDRCRVASVEIDALFAEARRKDTSAPLAHPSDAEMHEWARQWLQEQERNALLERAKFSSLGADERSSLASDLLLEEAIYLGRATNYLPADLTADIAAIANKHGVSILEGSREHKVLTELMRRAIVERLRRRRARVVGDLERQTFDELFAEVNGATSAPKKLPLRLGALIEQYAKDPSRSGLSQKTRDGYKVVFRVLRELLGENTPVTEIDRDDCRRVRDILASTPPNASKRFPNLSVEQAAQKAKAEGMRTLHPRAINSYLNNLSALFNYAVREQAMARNPAEGLRVALTADQKRDGKRAFDIDQLHAIFAAPLFTDCKDDEAGYATPGPNRPRRGRFWVPLLSLFHGLRLNPGLVDAKPEVVGAR